MAVIEQDKSKSLKVYVNIGTTQSPKSKTLTFNYFNPNAEDEKMLSAGSKIGACQTYPVLSVGAVEKATLVSE